VRPFFLTPDGQKGNKYKPYYDIATYIITQAVFCFTTAPFILLNLPDSLLVWGRVYFFAVIGVVVSMAFFASPAKIWLIKQQKKRTSTVEQPKKPDKEQSNQPLLGLPDDPSKDIDEAIQEIKQEVELRRRRGSKVTMPSGQDLKREIENRIGRKF
jgi:lysophospholipid acyltransferase